MANVEQHQIANTIINRAAVLCGLAPVTDAFATPDPNFITLRHLLDLAGQSLTREFAWPIGVRMHEFMTDGSDDYPLPDDFGRMVDQTGWQNTGPSGAWPLMGPATPQIWNYLVASQQYGVTVHAWFRVQKNRLALLPAITDIPVFYEYQSRAWVEAGDSPGTRRDHVQVAGDVVLYDPVLITQRLRLEFLQAKGFDTTAAAADYARVHGNVIGQDLGAMVLSLAPGGSDRRLSDHPINPFTNIPDSGYG